MKLLEKNTGFLGDAGTESVRCIEMMTNSEWTYHVDYYGICNIVYFIASGGKSMDISLVNNRYTIVDLKCINQSSDIIVNMLDSFLNIDKNNFPSLNAYLEKIESILMLQSNKLITTLDRQNILLFDSNVQ
jgi:hypothetical protein